LNGTIKLDATLIRYVHVIQTNLIHPNTYKENRAHMDQPDQEITSFVHDFVFNLWF